MVTDSMMPEGVEHTADFETPGMFGAVTDSMMPEGVEHKKLTIKRDEKGR